MTCCNEEPKNGEPKKEEAKILPDWKKVFVNREEFLKLVGLAAGGLLGLLITLPGAAFFLNYFLVPTRREWVKVGAVDNFKEGQTVDIKFEDPAKAPWDGITARRSAWLRRIKGENFLAFAVNCTHLGCPVRWEQGAELFLCPCHGGVYYNNGDVAGGPPPHPLHRYKVRVQNGQVEVNVGPVLTEG